MNKEELEAFAREAAKGLKTEKDLNEFSQMLRVWSFFDTASRNEDSELGWLVGAHVGDHQLTADLLRKLESTPTLLQALIRFKKMASTDTYDLEIGIEKRRDSILLYIGY